MLVSTTVIEVGVDVANATDDGGPRRRPLRRLPAPPAARPGGPRRAARACACWSPPRRGRHPGPRAARRRRGHHRRVRAVPGRPRAAPRGRRARRLAVRATRRACGCCSCCATRTSSSRPASVAAAVVADDPDAGAATRRSPSRCGGCDESEQADFLEKSAMTRIIGGDRRRPPASGRPRATAPGPRPTGCARRCSPPSSPRSARSTACGSSTCTPAAGRSAWRRRSRGRRRRSRSSSTTGARRR